MSELLDYLNEMTEADAAVVPEMCTDRLRDAIEAIEQKDKRIAELEAALYQSYLDNGCRPEEAKEYVQIAVGAEDGQLALKDTT